LKGHERHHRSETLNMVQVNENVSGVEHSFNPVEVRALVWKQDMRIVPLAAFIYLLCSLDRSNIG
jgi:hypothetical protein